MGSTGLYRALALNLYMVLDWVLLEFVRGLIRFKQRFHQVI